MAYQPKSYRKFLATSLSAVVAVSAAAPLAASAATTSFTDVPAGAWYAGSLTNLVDAGIIGGVGNNKFDPTGEVTRTQLAKMLVYAAGLDENEAVADPGFSDVKTTDWFYKDVAVAKAHGLMNGVGNGEFGVDATLTRDQMATAIVNAFNLRGSVDTSSVTLPYTDLNGSAYANDVKVLYGLGVLQNTTKYNPSTTVDRQTFVAFLDKTLTAVANLSPKVVSVSGIDATRAVVTFTQPVDPASLFVDGKSGAFKQTSGVAAVTFRSIDGVTNGSLTGTLSADGKTLTVTSSLALSKRYDVVVKNLTTANGDAVAAYDQVVSFAADNTAPTISSVTKLSASTFKVTFSEPMNNLGNFSFKLADGTLLSSGAVGSGKNVEYDFSNGDTEVTFTLGAGVDQNDQVVGTFIGAQDQALNLLTPNPANVTFVKGAKDGVAPTVSSINQVEANKFAVKFTEELQSDPTVAISDAYSNSVTSVDQDSTDPTKYIVTTSKALNGASTVSVSGYTDLSGEAGSAYSKVVAFVKDTTAPKVVSSSVVVDDSTRAEYLEVAFDKDVVLTSSTVSVTDGSYVKDYVTHDLAAAQSSVTVTAKSGVKNVVRVPLASLIGSTDDVKGATYSFDLSFSGVASASGIAAADASTSFTRGADGTPASTAVANVNSAVQDSSNNNKVNVTFDTAVDGASATNVGNYHIDGAIVESVTLLPASGTTQVAVLNLKGNSNTFTGTRNISITNVKALGSTKVMNAYYNTINLNENVAPTVTSATLVSTNQVKLTFSEAVTDLTGNDFEVLIGGKSQSTAENVNANVGSTATSSVVVTINSIDATELANGISLKALSTLDIKDDAGNKLSVPANITVAQ